MDENGYPLDSNEVLNKHMEDNTFISDALVEESKDERNELQRRSPHFKG